MARGTLTQKLLEEHMEGGAARPGEIVRVRVDQTLTQDATGTLVMLELEALGLGRVRTELSAQYVDHQLLQQDSRNAQDHAFLDSAARRFGLWFSRPGNGVSHPVHMANLGVPGKTLVGSDSHTCAAGSLGMLAWGAGGLRVAAAMAGQPLDMRYPEIWGIRLEGELPPFVSAKDVILELLRRRGVSGGVGRILEYHGPGLEGLSAMDRHVIANMGQELGATTSVFPADEAARRFLERQGRSGDFRELGPEAGARYDHEDTVDLSSLEPLIARPSSPGDVVPVREVAGEPAQQCYIGSSANPGYRDLAAAAHMVKGRRVAEGVSFDVNPTSREILRNLSEHGPLADLVFAGARVHQAGCNGCIGMGQAPAPGWNSLRTTPRNFPGRSGTEGDRVWLCSPETAAASALTGRITDPRELAEELGLEPPGSLEPETWLRDEDALRPPSDPEEARDVELVKGPNIGELPVPAPLPDELELPVLLRAGDDLSTDEILPAGTRVLPYRSNLTAISRFSFAGLDEGYVDRAEETGDHAVVGGENFGQGSSREHAALAPRMRGMRAVLARSFARIFRENLVGHGVLPLVLEEGELPDPGTVLRLRGIREALAGDLDALEVQVADGDAPLDARLDLRREEAAVLAKGGLIPWLRDALRGQELAEGS